MSLTVTRSIRQGRRDAAEKRQAEYDKLSTQEKIDKLPPEPGAKKQRAKLIKKLEAESKAVAGGKGK